MERRRHPGQQRRRDRRRQRQRQMTGRAGDVAHGSSAPSTSDSAGPLCIPVQNASSPSRSGCCACAASRCAQRRNEVPRGGSAGSCPCAIACQAAARSGTRMRHDTPSTDKMMDRQQQPPGLLRPGIEPHRLQHHARRRRKPALGRLRLLGDAARAAPPHPDPRTSMRRRQAAASTVAGRARSRRQASVPPRRRRKAQPQRIMMIEHRLQGGNQMLLLQARRHLQQHRLAEAIDRPAALQQPMHDRRRREAADRNVGQHRRPSPRQGTQRQPAPPPSDAGTPRAAVMTSPALRARLTSWIDMMLSPPSSKKLSSIPTRVNAQHLGKQRAQDLLLRRARRTPHARPPSSGAGSARRSSLPFGVSGRPIQHHDRRRHHVVRQHAATAQREAPQHPAPRPPPATT